MGATLQRKVLVSLDMDEQATERGSNYFALSICSEWTKDHKAAEYETQAREGLVSSTPTCLAPLSSGRHRKSWKPGGLEELARLKALNPRAHRAARDDSVEPEDAPQPELGEADGEAGDEPKEGDEEGQLLEGRRAAPIPTVLQKELGAIPRRGRYTESRDHPDDVARRIQRSP